MKGKVTAGIITMLVGIVAICFSLYIKSEVAEGKRQIASGQRKVDSSKQLFGLVPEGKGVGEVLTESGQRKIDQGKRDVATYEKISHWLMGVGIIVGVGGLLIMFIPSKKR